MTFSRVNIFIAVSIFILFFLSILPLRTDAEISENGDKVFLQNALNNASWMIILGELAEKQAASGDIRQYGVIMAGDYRKHVNGLHLLARQKGVSLLPDTDAARQNTTQYFTQKFGADFDRNYISLMMEENRNQLSFYQHEAQKGIDADVRALAAAMIKRLEGYVARAYRILLDLPKPVLK